MKTKNLSRLLITLLVMLFSVSSARAGWFNDLKHFEAYQVQDGIVHFKILNFGLAKEGDWMFGIWDAKIYCTIDDTTWWPIIRVNRSKVPSNTVYVHNAYIEVAPEEFNDQLKGTPLENDPGHIHITNDFVRNNDLVIEAKKGNVVSLPKFTNAEGMQWYLEMDYFMPFALHGKTNVKFKVEIEEHKWHYQKNDWGYTTNYDYKYNGEYSSHPTFNFFQNSPAKAATYKIEQPEILSSMVSYDTEDQNAKPDKVAVMFSHKRNVHSYKDDKGNWIVVNNYAGPMYVEGSDKVRKNFVFDMKEDYNNDSHEFVNVKSKPVDIPAFHRIYGFNAQYDRNSSGIMKGDIKLTWTVRSPKENDVVDNDFFEIQRATKADFSDAETLTLEMMETNPADSKIFNNEYTYTYIDATETTKKAIGSGNSPAVFYRIRRASSGVWEWEDLGVGKYEDKDVQDGYGCMSAIKMNAYLAAIYDSNAIPSWNHPLAMKAEDWEKSRKIEIYGTFVPDYNDSSPNKAIYDSTAPILIHKVLTMGDGSTLETTFTVPIDSIYAINTPIPGTMQFRFTDIADVPCVKYKYSIEVSSSVLESNPQLKYYADCYPRTANNAAADNTGFKFDSGIKMKSLTASQGYFADQVFLQWETEGGMFDTYTIYVKDGNTWKQIATTTDSYYNDKAAVGGVLQTYKVEGEFNCGEKITDSLETTGFRGVYGSISGRVAYGDNSGSPEVLVKAVPKKAVEVHKGSFYSANILESEQTFPSTKAYTVSVMLKKSDASSAGTLPVIKIGDREVKLNISLHLDKYKFVTFTETYDGKTLSQYIDDELISQTSEEISVKEGKVSIDQKLNLYYDELRLYTRALTETEVKNDYNRILSGKEDGLWAYYHFDETKELGRGYFYDNRFMSPGDEPRNMKFVETGDVSASYSAEHAQDDHLLTQSYTNLDGSYAIGGLAFLTGATYDITPVSSKAKFMFNNDPTQTSLAVEMSADNSLVTGVNAINTSSVRFTATVYYEGSTIPVYHANFLVNGMLAKDAAGNAIESDASGNAKFNIPTGEVTIQAVMKGHKFLNDGYILKNGTNKLNVEDNIDGAEFWDQTKVRLTGRIVGGDDEAKKKLYENLSVNNLGDNLQFVLELEGDNVSHFVYDNVNHDTSVKTRDEVFDHTHGDKKSKHYTTMNSTLKRVTIHPDPLTGEYEVLIYPARYVVRQASAEGYSTLFPTGVTSQSMDLSNFHDRDTAVYSLTYHSPISLTYEQMVYGMPQDYLGEKELEGTGLDLKKFKAPAIITDPVTKKTTGYVLGYPVFLEGSKYIIRLQAHEDYYYNNNPGSGKHAKVVIKGEDVRVHNGFSTDMEMFTAPINSQTGYALVTLDVNNPSYTLTKEDALRLVDVSVKVNGEYISAKDPLKGYISDISEKSTVNDVTEVISSDPQVIDIIRDPQGAGSFAYVEEGSKYDFSYSLNVGIKLGLDFKISSGTVFTTEQGISAIGPYTGFVMDHDTRTSREIPIDLGASFSMRKSYTQSVSKRISTSSAANAKGIGANADIYYGTHQKMTLKKVNYIGVMDSAQIRYYEPAIAAGLIKIVAKPQSKDFPYYLTMSQKLSFGVQFGDEFAYTQYYIINTLFPKLLQERDNLLIHGTIDEVQKLADQRGEVLYQSFVASDHPDFGIKYNVILPKGEQTLPAVDKIAQYNKQIRFWVEQIRSNEEAKYKALNAVDKDKFKIYSVVYGTNVTVTESTSYSFGKNFYWSNASGDALKWLDGPFKFLGSSADKLLSIMSDAYKTKNWQENNIEGPSMPDENGHSTVFDFKLLGFHNRISFTPSLNLSVTNTPTSNETSTVTRGFTLAEGLDSYEDILVYNETAKKQPIDKTDKDAFNFSYDDMDPDAHKVHNFIFLRKGGATRNPYLPEERTIFYESGFVLSPASLKIDNPKVTLTKHEISNVPADQAAVFEVILSNESEITDARIVKAQSFTFYQEDTSNTKGLRILMDGQPITDGRTFVLAPGDVIKKTIEVYRGSEYDYEDVGLTLMSVDDIKTFGTATFSVHYSRTGLPPTLVLPVNNWVLNTLSQKDKRGYYMPIEIDNINPNENFDHVELQYKLQTQGDDMWVNLCSYYADKEYYEKASGNKEMFEGTKIYNVKFYGENDPIEQRYDIRAVTFYRNGSSFVTASSEIRSGLKDTRVPQLFGAVTPKNGILGVGDYISIPFSEDIAANYLNKLANFEITGYTNSRAITGNTSLQFDGAKGSMAASTVTRNLHDKDFTIDVMVQPKYTDRPMVYFTQGTLNSYVEFGQDGFGCLYLLMKGKGMKFILSNPLDAASGWNRVAVSYENKTGIVRFYQGSIEKTSEPTDPVRAGSDYSGIGKIMLGNTVDEEHPFEGRMIEARLWSKVLTQEEIAKTYEVQLSGFEKNLLAYYPLTEGVGDKAKDKANGATLNLNGQTWNLPRGLAMHISESDTLALDGTKFNASDINDFTLSFWFRADEAKADTMALIASGRGVANEVNAEGRIFFGLAPSGNVVFQHNGALAEAVGNYADQNWHQVALTVNRAANLANLYVDDKLKDQLNASQIGSLSAGRIDIGRCDWTLVGDSARMEPQAKKYPFAGYIDDVVMWNSALPEQYMTQYYNQAPNGEEMALVNHLSFSQRKQNSSGIYETVYNPYNNKVVRDDNGNVKKKTDDDRLILNSDEYASSLTVDQTAPITEKDNLEKLDFSFMGKDNELVINIDRLDKDINKQNIFVTVTDVEDLAGNPMASPLTWVVYVDRNQVRWSDSYVIRDLGLGETDSFRLNVTNTGATTMNYEITDLPEWLTVDKAWGSVGPATDIPLEFKVGNILDAGEHTAIIYITDQNGLSDPLSVTVNVKADEPEWEIDDKTYTEQMSVVAQVTMISTDDNDNIIESYLDANTGDMVGAFINGKCVGKANITIENGNPIVYLTVRGKTKKTPLSVDYILWNSKTGVVSVLETNDNVFTFEANALKGTPESPVQFTTGKSKIQHLELKSGWNWISFNIKPNTSPQGFADVFVNDYDFTDGDVIKSDTLSCNYFNGTWYTKQANFNHKSTYMIYVQNPGTLSILGTRLKGTDLNLNINSGWNFLPYFCTETMSVTEALTSYYDEGTPGDVIKGYNEFAVMTNDHRWVGSLTHLRPGVGYMIRKQKSGTFTLRYPVDPADAVTPDDNAEVQNAMVSDFEQQNYSSSAMPVLATVLDENGEGANEGDILKAYDGDALVGTAVADNEGRFFLMTHAEDGQEIRFTLSGNGRMDEIATKPILRFNASAVIGTYGTPYVIDFNATDEDNAVVYDLEGRRVNNTQNGNIYIKNNKKVIK